MMSFDDGGDGQSKPDELSMIFPDDNDSKSQVEFADNRSQMDMVNSLASDNDSDQLKTSIIKNVVSDLTRVVTNLKQLE